MSGPKWFAMGVSPEGDAGASFAVGGAVSLLFHDHWSHIPDADDLANLFDDLTDLDDEDPADDSST